MLIDGISRKQLQERAISALIGANTLAGNRVFEPRDWPTRPELFPMLLAQTPRERKVSVFPGSPQFTTTITLVVVGRIRGPTPEQVEADLDQLSGQIENALLFTIGFADFIQQFAVIETQTAVTAEAKQHIGELGMTFELIVYQTFGPDGDPLTSIVSTFQPDASGANPIVIEAKA